MFLFLGQNFFPFVYSNTKTALIAPGILGQKEKDHMQLKANVVFIFILNMSLLIFYSGKGSNETLFPVSGSFLF